MYAYATDDATSADTLANTITTAIENASVTEDRREAAVNRLRTSHAAELQRVNGVADAVAWTTLFWNDPTYSNTVLAKYSTVTLDSVKQILNQCADVSQTVRLDVVPKTTLDDA